MSIITDTLNRLQAKRAHFKNHPQDQEFPQHAVSEVKSRAPQQHTGWFRHRAWMYGVVSLLGLTGVGFTSYLWGLSFLSVPAPIDSSQLHQQNLSTLTDHQVAMVDPFPLPHSSSTTTPPKTVTVKPEADRPLLTSSSQSPLISSPQRSRLVNDQPVRKEQTTQTPARLGKNTSRSSRRVLGPPSPQRRLRVAQILIKKQRYADTVTVLEPLFVSPPETWDPWFWMGTAKLGMGEVEEADHYFMEGLARDSSIAHLWVQHGVVGQQRGDDIQAIEALRQAELLAPDLPEVQLNLAFSFERQGHRTIAMQYYHRFLSLTEGIRSYRSARKKVLNRITRLGHI